MGAAEATAPTPGPRPPPPIPPPHATPPFPLNHLLHPSPTSPLPPDPDADLWPPFFTSYTPLDLLHPPPLTPLPPQILHTKSQPHIRALATAIRAATYRLRIHISALSAHTISPFHPTELLGALRFVRAVLKSLSSHAVSHDVLAATLGALDAPAEMPVADRVDIGHAMLWQLVVSALDLLHVRPLPPPAHLHAALDLILVALSDQLYQPTSHPSQQSLSAIVDRYTSPSPLLAALLDLIAAPGAQPSVSDQLAHGMEAVQANVAGDSTVSRASAISIAASATPFAQGGMRVGMAALAASAASSFNFQSGLQDALSLLSARFPLRPFGGGHASHAVMQAPDVEVEPYASFSVDAASAGSDGAFRGVVPNGAGVGGERLALGGPGVNGGLDDDGRGKGMFGGGRAGGEMGDVGGNPAVLAERCLGLLCLLCGPRETSPFREALFSMKDVSKKGQQGEEVGYSFSKLYETLGKWMAHPRGALLGYYLITGNRRFRTFALARTDPDVLLVPLLASMRKRCVIGSIVADAYIPASIMLMLTSDKGLCEAIDMINVPASWLTFIEDKTRVGNEKISLSGIVLLLCARVVQQSLVLRRRVPECFLAGICLAIMANVSGDVTNLHSLAAERLLSLVEFLGRRRKKAIILAAHSEDMPSEPPRISDSPRLYSPKGPPAEKLVATELYLAGSAKLSAFEVSNEFLDQLAEFLGLSLEVIVSVLCSRSSVSANRHLVYSLLHREAILDSEHVSKASVKCETLSHMLRRMVDFFGSYIDDNGDSWAEGNKRRSMDQHTGGSSGISVEKVFEVIDKNARHLRADIFEGLPELRFRYEEYEVSHEFVRPYSWSLATRSSDFFWDLSKSVIPVRKRVFQPSK